MTTTETKAADDLVSITVLRSWLDSEDGRRWAAKEARKQGFVDLEWRDETDDLGLEQSRLLGRKVTP